MHLTPEQIEQACHPRTRQQGTATEFRSISTDSRSLRKGALFCALSGPNFDGHRFISEALKKGAAGAIIQKGRRVAIKKHSWCFAVNDTEQALGDLAATWRNQFKTPIVAITGSNGKTTTKEMIAAVLETKFKTLKTQGNFNNLIGLPHTLFGLSKRHQVAALEMGMNAPGEIRRLCEIASPQVAVITNVARAHLEGLGSLAAVAKAKSEILEKLPKEGLAILNADDPKVCQLGRRTKAKVITYGFSKQAIVRGSNFQAHGLTHSSFKVHINGKSFQVRINLLGIHNATNALAALAVGQHFKLPLNKTIRALATIKAPQGRMTLVKLPRQITVINDCYNANPDSMEQALRLLPSLALKKRVLLVLGDMLELGKHSTKAHRELGRNAVHYGADEILAVGLQAKEVAKGAAQAGLNPEATSIYADAQTAGKAIKQKAKRGEFILIKGSRGIRLEKVLQQLKGVAA